MAEPKLALCGGQTRKGTLCRRKAGWGTSHHGVGRCSSHDEAPTGPVTLAERDALMAPVSIEPQDAILECIRISAGEVEYASQRIAELEVSQLVGEPRRTMVRKSDGTTVQEIRKDPPALHVWIVARQAAMDRLVAFSVAAVKVQAQTRIIHFQPSVTEEAADGLDDLAARRTARLATSRGSAGADS